ncbi:MAG: CRTAC1 family protein [Pseudomonadota bacterium]
MIAILLAILMVSSAQAEPRFEPRALPVEHIYSGGWEHFVGGGVAIFDCDGDGFLDLYLAGGAGHSHLLRNVTGKIGASIQFEQADIEQLTNVIGAYPLDIDNDAILDLFVLRLGENIVLRGDGACGFQSIGTTLGLPDLDRWSTAFSATWEPGSERPTLAVGNYVDRADPEGPFEACDRNELYRWGDSGYKLHNLEPGFCALSMLFSDWNRTGVQDLRVSNDRHYYVRGGSEQMWAMPDLTLREGGGWQPISIWGMGIASQDITGDGRPEVVLTSMGDQLMQIASEDGYEMARFEIGTFAQRPYIGDDGRPSTGWHAQFGDVDNDARSDLFIAKGNVDQMPGNAMHDPNNLLMQRPDGRFEEHGDRAGLASIDRSRGAGLADLNRDGGLDLVVVNRRAAAELYENVTLARGSWVQIQPRMDGSNSHAVGAWVEVQNTKQSQEITVGGGHVSGQVSPVHFGLGSRSEAKVRVIWPDGTQGPWRNLLAGRSYVMWKSGAVQPDR